MSFRICSPIVARKGTLPQDLRDAVIVSLNKNKGKKSGCSNYQGITLLSFAGKILAHVLLNRLVLMIVPGKHARKPVWVQVQQRDRRHDLRAEADTGEKQRTEHAALIDLTEAFDTVSREE